MKQIRKKNNGMKKYLLLLPVFLMAATALILGAFAPKGWADPPFVRLAEAEITIELNFTDGDAGIQIFLDGEGWDSMQVFDPDEDLILDFSAEGSVGMQGITELFFESAEPSFDEQPLDEFLGLFPEGTYSFVGTTTEEVDLTGTAELTHDLPCAPTNISGQEEEGNFIISWDAVENKLDNGSVPVVCGGDPITIVRYVGVITFEAQGNHPSFETTFEVPPEVTRMTVPPEFLEGIEGLPGHLKVEVKAIEESGNGTIAETELD